MEGFVHCGFLATIGNPKVSVEVNTEAIIR
jgi:hypothetical protein